MRILRRTAMTRTVRVCLMPGLLANAVVGECVEMPWGEQVTLLLDGKTERQVPLTPGQMHHLRGAVAGDPGLRPALLRLLLR